MGVEGRGEVPKLRPGVRIKRSTEEVLEVDAAPISKERGIEMRR